LFTAPHQPCKIPQLADYSLRGLLNLRITEYCLDNYYRASHFYDNINNYERNVFYFRVEYLLERTYWILCGMYVDNC
jgi:hypothetical protein